MGKMFFYRVLGYLVILSIILLFTLPLKAQVNIGSGDKPQSFSILELTANIKKGGLRLPLLTTVDRDNLNLKDIVDPDLAKAAKGIVIYNTTTNCLEFWNGEKWLSLCSDVTADCNTIIFPYIGMSYELCPNSKISDLNALIEGNVLWYSSQDATTSLDPSTPLSATTYYGEQNIYGCKSKRFPVSVTFGDCSRAIATRGATTFTDVMYDFQHQTLEAYYTGGIPTNYQWQVSITPNDGDFKDIDGAKFRFFTVPAHFADIYNDTYKVDTLFFRCKLSNSFNSLITINNFNIVFIRTEKADGTPIGNYGIDTNGVRYLTVKKGANGDGNGNTTTGSMKIALLNLGQSRNGDGSYNNDAGILSDYYQWGRVADGHQRIVWSKSAGHLNQILPFGSDVTVSSDTITKNLLGQPNYTTTATPWGWNQIPNIDNDAVYYGKFVKDITGDWGNGNANSSLRWGNGMRSRSSNPWIHPENNPCPSGWRVPSIYDTWDMFNGTGSDDTPSNQINYTGSAGNVNTWSWHDNNNNAIGGVIISNIAAPNEKVFLLGASLRTSNNGSVAANSGGYYWTSTYQSNTSSNFFSISSGIISMGGSSYGNAQGFFVRCVAE